MKLLDKSIREERREDYDATIAQMIQMIRNNGECPTRCRTCPKTLLDLCTVFNDITFSLEQKEQMRLELLQTLIKEIPEEDLFRVAL